MKILEPPGFEYRDRNYAGEILANRLSKYKTGDMIILAIPNGGVPVAIPISKKLRIPLYLLIVRKLQIPDNPEAGFGAITSEGSILLNEKLLRHINLSEEQIHRQREKALQSILSRQDYFGNWASLPHLGDRDVILVDDGLASGFTMKAAVQSARHIGAKSIIIAVPTSSMSAFRRLEPEVDRIVCPHVSRLPVFAVADAYENWYDVNKNEVLVLLRSISKPAWLDQLSCSHPRG